MCKQNETEFPQSQEKYLQRFLIIFYYLYGYYNLIFVCKINNYCQNVLFTLFHIDFSLNCTITLTGNIENLYINAEVIQCLTNISLDLRRSACSIDIVYYPRSSFCHQPQ